MRHSCSLGRRDDRKQDGNFPDSQQVCLNVLQNNYIFTANVPKHITKHPRFTPSMLHNTTTIGARHPKCSSVPLQNYKT